MKRILLTVLASVILLSTGVFGINAFAQNNKKSSVSQSTTSQSTYTTAERTDDDPFAESKPTVEKETPTFYYILVGVAGVIIVFAVVGLITSKNKK